MKICITSSGKTLESQTDPRFGRCPYLVIVDPETKEFEAIDNGAVLSGGGAGIQTGQLVNEKQVAAVLTGNVGPNAFQTLSAANIDIITGISGTVSDVIEKYKNGGYTPVYGPSVAPHSGMRNNG